MDLTITKNETSKKIKKEVHSVYNYTSYKTFLLDYFQQKKNQLPQFTMGKWAQKLNLGNTASLSRLLDGSRFPGPQVIQQITNYFQMNTQESEYFRYLILLEKNKKDSEMSLLIMEKLSQLNPQKKFKHLDHETFLAVSNWYYFVIREMILLPDFQENGEWIAKKLLFHISPSEAEKAISTLLKLGLVHRDEKSKRLYQKDPFLDWKSDVISEASKRNHEQNIENSKKALREIEISFREFNAVCMNVSLSDLPKMKKMIQNFKVQFIQKFENRNNADTTYQLQLQLFPFTKIEK